jgi:cytochrome c nitrite reductase small subunit
VKSGQIAAILTMTLLGVALGLGTYTFAYAKGWSYLTNNPAACANCHVMNEQYDGWLKGSHRSVAVCNDCHVPHTFLGKYYTKARNGFWHSFYFTTQSFQEPIQATAKSRAIAEAACRDCHAPVVQAMGTPAHAGSREISCIRCHGSVGHLELSATSLGPTSR